MAEMLLKIQEAALQLDPNVVWIPGVIAVIMGLFLWLGGNRYSALVVGLLGAGAGALLGLSISNWFDAGAVVSMGLGAAVFALLAVMMQKIVIVLLATVIFALACGSTYLGLVLDDRNWTELLEEDQDFVSRPYLGLEEGAALSIIPDLPPVEPDPMLDSEEPPTTDEPESRPHDIGVARLHAISNEIVDSASNNKTMLVLWTILGAVVGLTLAYLLKRIIMAICCSIVGATAVIAGMIALLLAKGVAAISTLQARPEIAPTLFSVMIVFGAICQLITARKPKSKTATHDEDDD